MSITRYRFIILLICISFVPNFLLAQIRHPPDLLIATRWKLQDSSKVLKPGSTVSQANFSTNGWYSATVPGTVLTTLVNNKKYPEPLYGENNRPDKIPESLNKTAYWYRTEFTVPDTYKNKQIYLNFDGINYAADVWFNGHKAGTIKGAFARGVFDVSSYVKPGSPAILAVKVSPQPNPGIPHEHTVNQGMGSNGGVTAIDGPTFLSTIGWDWLPAIRDRNTGIWQKVYLSAKGAVQIKNPLLTSDVALPGLNSADINIQTSVANNSDKAQTGVFKVYFGAIKIEKPVKLAPHSTQLLTLNPQTHPRLHILNPKLWWPNGYGPQNLYPVRLSFEVNGVVSDEQKLSFGIRKITYGAKDTGNLTISVNGVRIFCKGGNWGMDEALKRIPRNRLKAQLKMHQLANFNIIRNWVGQSTGEDFYDLCDRYGMLLWDEFFQPNPGNGPDPADVSLYMTNVREKILRFRNHASIAVWCARNEGYPPKIIDDSLRKLMTELEPVRLYQPSSTAGRGVNSGGPYYWRPPASYYTFNEAFKTEIGSMSIPTIESIHGMMPRKDWEVINDDWAEHDFANGAQAGNAYRKIIDQRYGKVLNLADFVRKGQLANYEAFRAMFEGRNAKLFEPCTGVITWMSNPAQPSFVWQIYHHDLEPNASLFAAKKACEPVHVQLNEKEGTVEVINTLSTALPNATVNAKVFDVNGILIAQQNFSLTAPPTKATSLGKLSLPASLNGIYFVKLQLWNQDKQLLSDNFYWQANADQPNNLQALNTLPRVNLNVTASSQVIAGRNMIKITLHNPTNHIALMAHLQLRRNASKNRVLPVYYSDNYLSLIPGETRTLTIDAALTDLKKEMPLICIDGYNIGLNQVKTQGVKVAINNDAQVENSPVTGLPMYYGPALSAVKINCGGHKVDDFIADDYCSSGKKIALTNGTNNTASIYQSYRQGSLFTYIIPLKQGKYTVKLHWAETNVTAAGQRKFNVGINGKNVLTDLDVFQETGEKGKLLTKQFSGITPTSDGTIEIQFSKGNTGEPFINAIEIVPE